MVIVEPTVLDGQNIVDNEGQKKDFGVLSSMMFTGGE